MQADALRPGDPKRLGSYELLGRLGDGGQGVVFLGRAMDGTQDGTRVAIKLLHRELTDDDTARVRFLREIEFAKQVASFCTAQILDADIEGERPYLVSEYVPGPSVLQLVQTDGPISGGALGRLAIGTATALVAIHQAGVIHRDFKPANVLIGPGGPRVIDFGIARVFDSPNTMTSRVIGTPAFMSPEQLRGREFGKEADIFCWGATMVYAATGRPPFGNDSIPAVIQRALNEEPDLGDIAAPLRGLIAACLAKHPADRPDARTLLMRLLGQEDARIGSSSAAAAPAADDPAAILVKIAEATARPGAGHHVDSSATQALSGPGDLPEATSPRLREAAYAELADPVAAPGDYDGPEGPADRPGRRRAAVLTFAAIVAVAVTAGGTAYVLAQSESGVQHVNNNPTVAPVLSETPSEEPTSAKPTKTRTPVVRPTLRPTPTRTASPRPSPTRTTRRPEPQPTPTKTRTSTPTPTPTPTKSTPTPTVG
jgi:hypothetical protein